MSRPGALFDPRVARVARTFEQERLPAACRLTAAGLQEHFAATAQAQSLQSERFEREFVPEGRTVDAAVLVALMHGRAETGSGLQVLLTQRPQAMSSHAGQIAFPGGKVDDTDTSIEAAALREAWEEVALPRAAVQVLGRLPVYTTGSGFAIHPVVALVDADVGLGDLRASPAEVEAVFAVRLADVMQPACHHLMQFEWQGEVKEWFAMPVRDTQGNERYVWGATAGMLRNLYRFLVG